MTTDDRIQHIGGARTPCGYGAVWPARVEGWSACRSERWPYAPAYETPDGQYPLRLTTGRTVYHWDTRTKTCRAPTADRRAQALLVA